MTTYPTPTDWPKVVLPSGPSSLTQIGRTKPTPLSTRPSSLMASARRLTGKDTKGNRTTRTSVAADWQEDAWEMYDLVGEFQFLVNTLAGRLGQARLYVGKVDTADGMTDAPEQVEDAEINDVLHAVGGSLAGRAQLLTRSAINLAVPGEVWLVGIPDVLIEQWESGTLDDVNMTERDVRSPAALLADPFANDEEARSKEARETPIVERQWRVLSVSEIVAGEDEVTLKLDGTGDRDVLKAHPDDLVLIRIWNPHPRKAWEANSAARSALPVLRELVGLTMHVSAQVDSRLAGAGVLVVPQSAQHALRAQAAADPTYVPTPEDDAIDFFTEALMEAMTTPINDRASAAAVVPLVITAPDDVVDKFKHISFSSGLDEKAADLRDESIRRLALGMSAPPELLLGTAGMNHWGAWLVQEDVVATHLEPTLALICDALTTEYLWPALREQLDDPDADVEQYVVWYDVSDLTIKPNRSSDALELHTRGAITDGALRTELGFDDAEAPEEATPVSDDQATRMALDIVQTNPGLLASPGLPSIVAQIKKVLNTEVSTEETTPIAQEAAQETAEAKAVAAQADSAGEMPTDASPPADVAPADVPDFDAVS